MTQQCGVRKLFKNVKKLSDILVCLEDSDTYEIQNKYKNVPNQLAERVNGWYLDVFNNVFLIHRSELRKFNTYFIDTVNEFSRVSRPYYNLITYNNRWQSSHKYAGGYQMIQTLIEIYIEEYGDIDVKDVEANIRNVFSMNGEELEYIAFYITSKNGAIILSIPINLLINRQILLSFSKYGLDFVNLIKGFPKQFVFELIGLSGEKYFRDELLNVPEDYRDVEGGWLTSCPKFTGGNFPSIGNKTLLIKGTLNSQKFGKLLETYLLPEALCLVSSNNDRIITNYFDKYIKNVKNPVVQEVMDDEIIVYPEIIGDSSYIGTMMSADYKKTSHIKSDLSIVELHGKVEEK